VCRRHDTAKVAAANDSAELQGDPLVERPHRAVDDKKEPQMTASTQRHERTERTVLRALLVAAIAARADLTATGPARAQSGRRGDENAPSPTTTLQSFQSSAGKRFAGTTFPKRRNRAFPGKPARHAEHDEEDEGAGRAASLTSYMTYRGGWTQRSPRIYLIFWGDWSAAGDPYNVQNRLYYFYNGVGGSSWNQTQTQYGYSCGTGATGCAGGVKIANTANQFFGWWKDVYTAPPLRPTEAQVAAEAQRGMAYFGDRGVDAQYVVAMPTGVLDQKSINQGFCAWHHYTWSYGNPVSYTSMPYLPDRSICGTNKVNAGAAGTLDGVTILAGHEYTESQTDPFLDAWMDADGAENADKCLQWGLGGYFKNVTFSTGTFAVQPQWSNYHLSAYNNGCYFF
jgi:hypothetical protein